MGLCPSVSVCLSQADVLLKRQNVDHTNNTTRYPRDSSFLMPEISAKFGRSHPLRGRRMQVGGPVLFCDGTSWYGVPENLTTGLQFFCLHNRVHGSEIPIVLSNLLYHYFFHWIMAHFNFVISQNAKWGHAGFYIVCHRMTVPENILLQKSTGWVKIGDFRQITGYISKTVQDWRIWFLLKSNRKSYALYRMMTLPITLSAP